MGDLIERGATAVADGIDAAWETDTDMNGVAFQRAAEFLLAEMSNAACDEGAVLSAKGFIRQFADNNDLHAPADPEDGE